MSHPLPALDRANWLQLVGADDDVSAPAPTAPHRERVERAAWRTGRSADEIALHEFDLSHYTEEGVFGHVDTGGCGALYRQLDWRELGVVLPPTTIDIRASRIALLPNTHRLPLMRRASQAHTALARWSFTRQVTRTVLQRARAVCAWLARRISGRRCVCGSRAIRLARMSIVVGGRTTPSSRQSSWR